jgi:acyl carrier protein
MRRTEVVATLARLSNRSPDEVGERIDSLELARFVYEVEQRYGVELDLTDEQLARMSTVDGTVAVLGELAPADG